MKVAITKNLLDRTKSKGKPYEIRDKNLTGFIARVQPTGKITFYCEYKRSSRIKLGPYPSISITDARIAAHKILALHYNGIDPKEVGEKPIAVTKFAEFLESHYFPWVEANHKNPKDTRERLLVDCRMFSKSKFTEITPHSVEKWRLFRLAKGNSPHTVNKSFAYLKASLSKAEEWEIFTPNPIGKMKKIKTNQSIRIRYLSVDEEALLRGALGRRETRRRNFDGSKTLFTDHLMPMVLISLNTGLRRGELFSLKWENINFNLCQLSVVAENSKSRKVRHIPLNLEAKKTITEWRMQSPRNASYVFEKPDGSPFKDVKTSWGNLLSEATIHNFRWHDMRHHFASKLAMAGVDLNTVRELLGHSSYEMTLRYAHLSAGHKADAVALL